MSVKKSTKKTVKKKTVKKSVKKAVKKVVKKSTKKVVKKVEEVVDTVNKVFGLKFQNYTLRRVLGSGHTKTHYKCLASDSGSNKVTVHVPRDIIDRV